MMSGDRRAVIGSLVVLALLAAACGRPEPRGLTEETVARSTTTAGGDPAAGALLFERECARCHATGSPEPGVGPSLYLAGMRFNVDFIRQSVLHPGEYEAGEHPPGVMPTDLGRRLTDREIEDVVAFVATLR
jgi:mono/diheme cytochrome c family protein